MRLELKRIQHELGTTFVFVTHDQEEALSMSDRIAVMNHGIIEQLGRPREIYQFPETTFVADFVGVLNAVELTVDRVDGADAIMRVAEGERVVVPTASTGVAAGSTVLLAVRPERIRIGADGEAADMPSRIGGTVAQIVYLGTLTQFHVDTTLGTRFIAHRLSDDPAARITEGDTVTLSWAREDGSILRSS
jgi:spermidine/putrescine transport system ATP-binding protein